MLWLHWIQFFSVMIIIIGKPCLTVEHHIFVTFNFGQPCWPRINWQISEFYFIANLLNILWVDISNYFGRGILVMTVYIHRISQYIYIITGDISGRLSGYHKVWRHAIYSSVGCSKSASIQPLLFNKWFGYTASDITGSGRHLVAAALKKKLVTYFQKIFITNEINKYFYQMKIS